MKEKNIALLGKWLWRFSQEHGTLWYSIIQGRYGADANGWDCNRSLSRSHSLCWKHITQVSPLFYPHTHFLLDNCSKIRFWKDHWWGNSTLEVSYPRLFCLACHKNAKVEEVLSHTPNGLVWNLPFSGDLHDWEIPLVGQMMEDLKLVYIFGEVPDSHIWSLFANGSFSCKSFYLVLVGHL